MSSTNKTNNLQLNSWIGSDIPQREDFNTDNIIIDSAITNHKNNTEIHTSTEEKAAWNNPYYISSYMGNGSTVRIVDINCGFIPSWGIVFAANMPLKQIDFDNKACYNYFSVVKNGVSSIIGVELENNMLKLSQSGIPVFTNEYGSFNDIGTTYIYIMFR